jgi:hypothetical protein
MLTFIDGIADTDAKKGPPLPPSATADNYPEMEGLCSWDSKHFGIKPTLTHAS